MWPTNKQQHSYMRDRQKQNEVKCLSSKAESWMREKLDSTGKKWTRQAQWGYRLFDFWNHELGIAVEVDGKEHVAEYDRIRDQKNYDISGIVVLRVRNFNEADAATALNYITTSMTWNKRRAFKGMSPVK